MSMLTTASVTESSKKMHVIEIDGLTNHIVLPKVKRKGGHVVHIQNKSRLADALKTTSQLGVGPEDMARTGEWSVSRHTTRRISKPRRSRNTSSIDADAIVKRSVEFHESNRLLVPSELPDPEAEAMYRELDTLKEKENTYIKKGFLPLLQREDLLDRRRCALLHKRWTMNVYDPLHTKVTDQLQGPRYEDMVMTRHMMYMAYLEHRNRKKDVFLDEVVDPPRGYRYVHQDRLWLHARTGILRDPTITVYRKRTEEDGVVNHIDTAIHSFPSIDPYNNDNVS